MIFQKDKNLAKRALFNLPKAYFSADSWYPQLKFRVCIPDIISADNRYRLPKRNFSYCMY